MVPSLFTSLPETMQQRREVQDSLNNVTRLQVDSISQEQLAEIANTRYQNGCTFIVSKLDPGQAAALGEGINVTDYATGNYLPSGTVVCDFVGNTAVLEPLDLDGDGIANPAATDFAFTGDRMTIDAAMQRAGFAAQINNLRNSQ
ncbi:hypothetical protein [Leptolyngbya sp. FACHB-16]|uniref:hypothetical protein n=1 Tax=unclassified Leptolyngbya TaxID=2650499 RepID=UPI001A7E7D41|nr:hypothetical protein [Leptolyngbya sp. FACHB-16]